MPKMTHWPLRYGVAVAAVIAGIAFLLIPQIGRGLGSILFLAVLISAWYGGMGPGLLATALITFVAIVVLAYLEPEFAPWRVVSIVLFVVGGVLITLLVEALHAARRRVEAGHQWLTAALTSIGDAVIATDTEGCVNFLNPVARALTGWESEQALGQPLSKVFRVVAEGTGEPVEDPVTRVLREEVVVGLANHSVLIARDGTERPIDDSAAPIKERSGATTGVILVFRNITERKRLEQELVRRMEQLAQADVRKDQFLAMLAHELRNPMAAISNAAQVAALGGAQDQIDWCMDVVTRQVKHLARLIDDLLDVARVTQGKIQLRKQRVDVAQVLHSAIESVRPLVESRQHKLTIAIVAGTLPAEADPVRLEQIVTNLLTNAAKYTQNGGEIFLSAGQEDESIVIKVRDTGMGIPSGQISQMFELFAQGDRSLARSEGGLGIGLTLARSLTEMHGGRLTATSDGPGMGSEFVVRLPTALPRFAGPMGPEPVIDLSRRRGLRVLVIDDHPDTTQGLARLLRLLNHEVLTAHDGPTGIEAARAHRPEVLLLDIGLPGMDGYQVAEKLRREDFGKDMLLIAVTGYGREEDRQRALSAGFDHFVTKPVDCAALQAIMAIPDWASP
jgi:PAS domain S-box-containing protein